MCIANYIDSTVKFFELSFQLSAVKTFRPKLLVKSRARFGKEVHSESYDSRGHLHPFCPYPFTFLPYLHPQPPPR